MIIYYTSIYTWNCKYQALNLPLNHPLLFFVPGSNAQTLLFISEKSLVRKPWENGVNLPTAWDRTYKSQTECAMK